MKFYEADIYIERAKVYGYEARLRGYQTPEGKAAWDNAVAAARSVRQLIDKLKYEKRLPELESVEARIASGQEQPEARYRSSDAERRRTRCHGGRSIVATVLKGPP